MGSISRALIVDDDEDILRLCRATLRAFTPWEVDLASSASQAIRVARRLCPDVILLDVMMPGRGGLMLLELLKRWEGTAHIPVVLMTAAAAEVGDCRGRGAAGLIAKPFDPETLSARIERIVEEAS